MIVRDKIRRVLPKVATSEITICAYKVALAPPLTAFTRIKTHATSMYSARKAKMTIAAMYVHLALRKKNKVNGGQLCVCVIVMN